jgi:hypothetical protein
VNEYSFECTACGKCCNSPPALSMSELFRFRDVFIGCIAVGRIRYHAVPPPHAFAVDDANAITITTLAFDYASTARCPALMDDGLCSLHVPGKPDQCIAVPLDPLVSDDLQHAVLAQRSHGAGWIGEQCIKPGEYEGALLLRGIEIVDADAGAAMQRRRQALQIEREIWSTPVFDGLLRDFSSPRHALSMLPEQGYRTIAIVPALLAIGCLSRVLAELCIAYIDGQTALIERSVARAIERRRLDDRPTTQTMRGFADALQHARRHLSAMTFGTATTSAAQHAEEWFID